jgi:UDP-GlcNAc:undecaprenyl-phosphate GlcNAc-1-phosphate transferase
MLYGLKFFLLFLISQTIQDISVIFAKKFNLYDKPGKRKIHKRPIPRIGGIGIFIASLIGTVWFSYVENPLYLKIFSVAAVIFVIGFLDDILGGINNKIKLVFQIIAASLLYFQGIKITLFINNPIITYFLTVVWIVGITNSFNLIDNMNGLASGLAMINFMFFSILFFMQGNTEAAYFCLIFVFSILGFYVRNFPEAKIFMGDGGSNYIGFVLAAVSVAGVYTVGSRLTHLPVIAPVIILSVTIYDTLSVMIIRKLQKRSIFEGDTNHISHRLVKTGLSTVHAVLVIYLIAIISGITAIILRDLYVTSAVLVLLQTFFIYVLISILVFVGGKDEN